MPTFRCTSCRRRVESPVLLGAGDCPHCGGDLVFDIHGERGGEGSTGEAPAGGGGRRRRLRRRPRR